MNSYFEDFPVPYYRDVDDDINISMTVQGAMIFICLIGIVLWAYIFYNGQVVL
jgi:hypothetical protein